MGSIKVQKIKVVEKLAQDLFIVEVGEGAFLVKEAKYKYYTAEELDAEINEELDKIKNATYGNIDTFIKYPTALFFPQRVFLYPLEEKKDSGRFKSREHGCKNASCACDL